MINGKIIIGLTGPIGSGKTKVSQFLINEDVFVINADKVSHELLNTNLECHNKIVAIFSDKILNNKGKIDRKKLGKLAFNNSQNINKLTDIMFPYITNSILQMINLCDNCKKYIILDAPTLIQSKLYKICDKIIVILSDKNTRIKRIIARDILTIEEVNSRIKNQLSDEEYCKYADYIIHNDKDQKYLQACIYNILHQIYGY